MIAQQKGRTVPPAHTNGTNADETRTRLETRLADLRAHHHRLAEELRIVGVVIGEMEAILNGPVVTEGSDNAPPTQ
jgi:hypothetical protein